MDSSGMRPYPSNYNTEKKLMRGHHFFSSTWILNKYVLADDYVDDDEFDDDDEVDDDDNNDDKNNDNDKDNHMKYGHNKDYHDQEGHNRKTTTHTTL